MCFVVETLISLGYGVMVTQQILVLFFLVRIRVAQQINEEFGVSDSFFVYSQCYSFDSHGSVIIGSVIILGDLTICHKSVSLRYAT